MRFIASAPPPSAAPALGPANFVFLSPRVGFVATSGGGGWLDKVGFLPPSQSGEIERTSDGGLTWTVLLRARSVVFDQIASADGRHVVALGNVVRGSLPASPVAYVSDDGGAQWRRVSVPAPVDEAVLDLPAPDAWYAAGERLLYSGDEGQTWNRRALPSGATGRGWAVVAFPARLVGYAAGSAPCGEQIYKTTDGAQSWTPLPGTCDSSYSSIDFLNASTGWAVRGDPAVQDDGAFTARVRVLFTDDGGRSWSTVYRGAAWPVNTRLLFGDRLHGWAVSSIESQGFFSNVTHTTTDGGHTWHVVGFLPWAVAGSSSGWSGDPLEGTVLHTRDGGRSVQVVARPENVNLYLLEVATASALVVDSSAGTLRSDDDGRNWRPVPPYSQRTIARALHKPAYFAGDKDAGNYNADYLTGDGGRTWSTLNVPASVQFGYTGDLAFSNHDDGLVAAGGAPDSSEPSGQLPVFATVNAGTTWTRVAVPHGVTDGQTVSLGPGVVVIEDPPLLYVSTDAGRHWRTVTDPSNYTDCGVSRPQPRAIWILCDLGTGAAPMLLLRSDDGGRTWRKLTGPVGLGPALIALDAREAWALAERPSDAFAPAPAGQVLWHTTDGGRSWHEVWPDISPTPVASAALGPGEAPGQEAIAEPFPGG